MIWENDKIIKGKYTDLNGNVYQGDILDGMAHGYGKLVKKGEEYEGEFKYNLYDGQGSLKQNGKTFKGSFELGKKKTQQVQLKKNSTLL